MTAPRPAAITSRSPAASRTIPGGTAHGGFDHRHRAENQPQRRSARPMPEGVGPRPGLHRPDVVLDLPGRPAPVDQSVGLLQPRGLRRQGGVLREGLDGAKLQSVDRLPHQPRPQLRQPWLQFAGGFLGADRQGAWAMHGPASIRGVMWITVTPVWVSPW